MFFGEVPGLAGFEVNHADHAILHDQRNRQLGAYVGNGFDVVRLFGYVLDQDRLAGLRGAACHTLADFHPGPVGNSRG